ncbi:MAG: molybdopterin-dependent oxidoreductase [Planctomycetia bacterium]|nr:molybdopterin-dependent oxidoreductase [Planctomycetia bacterium]
MRDHESILLEHVAVSRRYFLKLGAAGAAALQLSPLLAFGDDAEAKVALAAELAKFEYLTTWDNFRLIERGEPLPYTHPIEKLREVGLTQETWKLEVVSDPDAPAKLDNPLSKELGTALDWQALMKLAETRAVRYLKVMTCNNIDTPLGMGLWEGVPLRDVIWLAKPVENVRRVFYYGYHNDAPKQIFRSSLPIGRVLEDPPGEYPVLLCYKLNGEFLDGKRGGPVRMLVPDAYGFKSVKWLIRVVLTNAPFGNDTYANGNNDVDSWMKTSARIISRPAKVKVGQPVPVTGMTQVGISGLTKVQYSIAPQEPTWPADDPWFTKADWKDAQILGAPEKWGGGLAGGDLPTATIGFDATTGKAQTWPLRYSIVHWSALLTGIPAGKYDLRCRSIDANGYAQPLPRPFLKSGGNAIQTLPLTVEEA